VKCISLAFVYYIESVDVFLHTVNHVMGKEGREGGREGGRKERREESERGKHY
jgi:hypothetical protein